MGALLLFQPADAHGVDAGAWARARGVLTATGLKPLGERSGPAPLAAFRAGGHATGGWAEAGDGALASAGTWVHPSIDAADDAAALTGRVRTEGAGALASCEGGFVVAWARPDGSGFDLALDGLARLGAYAAERPEGTWVSTSARAIAAAVGAGPDPLGVAELLATGTLREGRTPFAGIRRLAGARRWTLGPDGLQAHGDGWRWGLPGDGPSGEALPDDLLARLDDRIRRAFARRPRPLADLTGGVDSRIVVGAVARLVPGLEVTVSGPERSPDVRVARRLAAALGLRLHHVDAGTLQAPVGRFADVLRAARLLEGNADAVDYAGTAALHARHAATHDASLNGSGGGMWGSYWWDARDLEGARGEAAARVVRHLAAAGADVPFLDPALALDPRAHLAGVVARSFERHAGEADWLRLDRALLELRIACWQGALASATMRLWPTLSPLLWEGVLGPLLAADPRCRLDARLQHALLARLPVPCGRLPLATGFPPARPRPGNVLRFLPGAARRAGELAGRVARRVRGGGRPDPAMRTLLRDGAADFLDWASLRTAPLLDRGRFLAWRSAALADGRGARPLLGRLIALEVALRDADSVHAGGERTDIQR